MALEFPIDCVTPAERTEYSYRAQELLRLDHNEKGQDFKDEKISKSEWLDYKINTFDPKSDEITKKLLEQRALLKKSTKWIIDIGTI